MSLEATTDDDEIRQAAEALEGRPPADILDWASGRFAPRLAFSLGFGPEGAVLFDLIARHRLPIDVFTLDTGLLFPETYALWRKLEERYGRTIRAERPALTVDEQSTVHGPRLWETEPDRCCGLRKLEPLRRALDGHEAWVSAIRRDQTADRAQSRVVERDARFGLVKVNPLAAWTSAEVWAYVAAQGVPVSPLHAQGYPSIGCQPCTTPVRPGEDPRAGRWRGRGKTECGLHPARRPPRTLTLELPTNGGH